MDTHDIWLVTFDHEAENFEVARLYDLVKIGSKLYAENNPTKYSLRIISAHGTMEEANEPRRF
jgi:hypothetical protein